MKKKRIYRLESRDITRCIGTDAGIRLRFEGRYVPNRETGEETQTALARYF
jgi:hypothetical protein